MVTATSGYTVDSRPAWATLWNSTPPQKTNKTQQQQKVRTGKRTILMCALF